MPMKEIRKLKRSIKNATLILMDAEHYVGVTSIDNLAQPLTFYQEYTIREWVDWNRQAQDDGTYWVSEERYYQFHKLCEALGYATDEFKVLIPKEENPFVFRYEQMCILVCPYSNQPTHVWAEDQTDGNKNTEVVPK